MENPFQYCKKMMNSTDILFRRIGFEADKIHPASPGSKLREYARVDTFYRMPGKTF
jgi:hypothetical protein